MKPRDLWGLIKQTITEWLDDKAPTYAAALAYYTIFSIAPLLIIAVGVAGFVFGGDAVRGDIHRQLEGLIGTNGAKVIEDMMVSASKPGAGIPATILGVVVLFFGASGLFAQLQETMNVIWKVKSKPTNGIIDFFRRRFLSFAMVLGIGFLLLVSLVINAAIAALFAYFRGRIPGSEAAWHLVNIAVSFGVVTILFAAIYKILPDTRVEWRDVWLGAAVTSLLFSLGKFAIALYLGKTSVASSYGAAGSVAIVLIWVYYSAQILFLGAEFTQVYAKYRRERESAKRASERSPAPSRWPPTPLSPGAPAGDRRPQA
jgi:membrane protein